jgi:UPF0716 family protein affecting phage T7 exclusion
MVSRLLLIYAVVELAVIFALVSTIGWGWTLLVLLGTFVLGWGLLAPIAGSHLIRGIRQWRSDSTAPSDTVGEGALIALATVLVLIPGLATTALGLLLLIPPIRAAVRPGLTVMGMRGLRRRVPLIADATVFGGQSRRGYPRGGPHGDYVDGEVVDVRDFRAPAPPAEMRGGFPGHPGWDQ